ncbi:uncharacterized protein LOC6566260 [Drosophila grimshawi]|uniref:GH24592 n=1 Tax=Drosophila grimshawi TaxID=7222 RepID=B4JM70_DROGR|nr:uncharacterized protein LOC6566260 [Drosophila grimshawi]XP_043071879.1 uncharacterized protein LOC6566260 [Drosophila grimshawi]EDV91831.1 GH24592 [Drosophila grimshawi]
MSGEQQPSAAAAVNLAKIVNLIGSNVQDEEPAANIVIGSSRNIRLASSGIPRRSTYSYIPKSPQLEEIIFAEPTFSERFARYFVIVIYLCGLCSLGFILSIYHFFAWDSRMPPVFKGQKKAPAFG